MGQLLHHCATTTEAIRRAIQNSQASLRELAARYSINPKTAAKSCTTLLNGASGLKYSSGSSAFNLRKA
jgi:hypothetical protein